VGDIALMRLVFEVVGDGNGIKTIAQRLLNANRRPYATVREHRMDMQVDRKRLIPWYVGKANGAAAVGVRLRHHGGRGEENNSNKCSEAMHIQAASVLIRVAGEYPRRKGMSTVA